MRPGIALRSLLLAAAAAWTAPVAAQAPVNVAVGTVASQRNCTTYQLQWGRESMTASSRRGAVIGAGGAAYAARDAMAYRRAWGTDLVRDCVSNFPRLRASLRDALAASGQVRVGAGGYTLSGELSSIGSANSTVDRPDMNDSRDDAVVNVRYSLQDRAGRSVFGGVLSKRVTLSAGLSSESGSFSSSEDTASGYGRLQSEVALAIARAVSFHFVPLRVVDVSGNRVRLNYGAPFLTLGATVLVPTRRGMTTIKALVVSAASGSALAEVDGSGAMDDVAIGAPAQFVEADDPAANSRRYDRVDLPQ